MEEDNKPDEEYRTFNKVPISNNTKTATFNMFKDTECRPQGGRVAIEYLRPDTQRFLDKNSVTINLWLPEQKTDTGIGVVVQLPYDYDGEIEINDILVYGLQTSINYKGIDYVSLPFIIAIVGKIDGIKNEITKPSNIVTPQTGGKIIT